MRASKVKKAELLAAVKQNREGHRQEFLTAQEGWRKLYIEELDRQLAAARDGKQFKQIISFPAPEDHTKDYDRVIRQLEMEQEEVLEIFEDEFAKFVMDDWAWKAQWGASTAAYMAEARRA
jgi:hypothetical protein